ncbi:MAG: enoyl-CoA hydratase-related protein [Gammaproteobacteria bacterium]|nr:enoyl-CoA hydratase-related protein [Gammaproteobacteria bacterium]
MSESLITNIDKRGVASLVLNRPEKHNAFDGILIQEITRFLTELDRNPLVRLLVITGNGKSFSSGADLSWMKAMVTYDLATNKQDAYLLADLMKQLKGFSKPIIAGVNGNAFGGAIGIIACCDIAIASDQAKFCFSEVLLGIAPAVISPYVINAIGQHNAKRFFLTGELFFSSDALNMGLIHYTVPDSELENTIENKINLLLKGGPIAQQEIKKLINQLSPIEDITTDYTVDLIARLRVSEEGQNGLNSFLEKQKPDWLITEDNKN